MSQSRQFQKELEEEEEVLREAAGKQIATAKPSVTENVGAAGQVANAVKNLLGGVGKALGGRPAAGVDEDQLTLQRDVAATEKEKKTIEGCVSGEGLLRKNKFRARSAQVA